MCSVPLDSIFPEYRPSILREVVKLRSPAKDVALPRVVVGTSSLLELIIAMLSVHPLLFCIHDKHTVPILGRWILNVMFTTQVV